MEVSIRDRGLIVLAIQKAILDGLVVQKRITKFEAERAFNILLENLSFLEKTTSLSSTS